MDIMGSKINEETRELPYASEVETLYRELWGQKGPESVSLKIRQEPEIEVNRVWSPITLEHLMEKFKKIKADTALGPCH